MRQEPLHRTHTPRSRPLAAVALALSLGVTRPAVADSADTYFQAGVAAAEAGNLQLSHEKLRAAWALRQTYDVAASLATVERALGKYRDAAEHYQFALDNFPPASDRAPIAGLEAGLAEARKHVGELTISVIAGAVVELDGKIMGVAPLKSPVFVEPGQITIRCTKPDLGEGRVLVEARVGVAQEARVELRLSSSTAPIKQETPAESTGLPLWPGLVAGGLGVAGVGAGIGLSLAANGAAGEADSLTRQLPSSNACLASAPADSCAAITDELEAHDALNKGAIAALVSGGALLATGVVLFSVSMTAGSEPSESPPAITAITPWFDSSSAGVSMSGRF